MNNYKFLCSVPIHGVGKPKSRSNFTAPMQRYIAWQREFVTLLTLAGYAAHRNVLPLCGLVVLVETPARRKKHIGLYKQTKPDIDNLQKSLLDSLWGKHGLYAGLSDDNAVGHIEVVKVWGSEHRISFFHNTDHADVLAQLTEQVASHESNSTNLQCAPVKPSSSGRSPGRIIRPSV